MSPAPTARVQRSPICARFWKQLTCAFTPIPRPIWCGSTNAIGSAGPGGGTPGAKTGGGRAGKIGGGATRGRRGLTQFLGDTLMTIAREKAAIMKRDVPAICAEQPPEAIAVIEQQAKRMHAPLYAAGQEGHVNVERGGLAYQDDRGLMDLAAPRLFGRHQFDNAGLAIATLRAQNVFKIDTAAFEAGIVNAEWPARMQRLTSGALVDNAPQGCEIWLDGGHNAEGRRVAAAALGDLEERGSRPLGVIVGMWGNKDGGAFLANFAGLTRHIIAVQIPDRDSAMPPDRLADAARQLGMRVETAASVEAALRSLVRLAYEVPPRILITGSLYLAGHVLAANGTPPG